MTWQENRNSSLVFLYTGQTNNMKQRLERHREGLGGIRTRGLYQEHWELVLEVRWFTPKEARKLETQIERCDPSARNIERRIKAFNKIASQKRFQGRNIEVIGRAPPELRRR